MIVTNVLVFTGHLQLNRPLLVLRHARGRQWPRPEPVSIALAVISTIAAVWTLIHEIW